MARAETGQKPRITADRVKKSGPPIPNETGATAHAEPETAKHEKKPKIRGPPVEPKASTIPEFCEAHRISIDTYFRMQRAGTGPEIMKVGHSTRITIEAAAAWREVPKKVTVRRERKAADAVDSDRPISVVKSEKHSKGKPDRNPTAGIPAVKAEA